VDVTVGGTKPIVEIVEVQRIEEEKCGDGDAGDETQEETDPGRSVVGSERALSVLHD
jgi:hypothetical protein